MNGAEELLLVSRTCAANVPTLLKCQLILSRCSSRCAYRQCFQTEPQRCIAYAHRRVAACRTRRHISIISVACGRAVDAAKGRSAAQASIEQRRDYGAAPQAPAGGPLSKSAERNMREGGRCVSST
jgi:hypothetical protein